MPLSSRGVTHVLANRAKIREGRSETVVLVSFSGGLAAYAAVGGCVWYDANTVPAGVSNRTGEISRTPHDAVAEFPSSTAFPVGLRLYARTATPTAAAVNTAEKYVELDRRRIGLGTVGSGGGTNYGDRWFVRLRKVR